MSNTGLTPKGHNTGLTPKGHWWLAAYARRRVLPVREREDRDAAAEMQILADLDRALELPKAEAKALVQSLLFPPPSPEAVDAMLSAPGPGGIPWDDRLRHWERGTRDAMRRELSAGVGAGENVAELEKRLRPRPPPPPRWPMG